jgi:hypothetical protein
MSQQEQTSLIEAIVNLVKTTGNDMELGTKIRELVPPDLKIPKENKIYY